MSTTVTPLIDLETAPPAEFDTLLADLHREYQVAQLKLERALDQLHYAVGDRKEWVGQPGRRRAAWRLTHDQAETAARESGDPYALRKLGDVNDGRTRVKALSERINECDETWARRGGWSRFYSVPGGHVHSDRGCHTLRITTRLTWNPGLSGKTEAEAVAALGPTLCTHCFPSAPVEWTRGKEDTDRCPGSNKAPVDGTRRWAGLSQYGKCPECGGVIQVTMSGLRKHKPKGAKK